MRRLLAGLVALVASGAPTGSGTLTIRTVDTGDFPTVSLSVLATGAVPTTTDFHVRENGAAVPDRDVEVRPLTDTGRTLGTVLVLDVSGSMNAGGALTEAKAAAKRFIATRARHERVALVAFAGTAQIRLGFTEDASALEAAVDSLAAEGETALWDALVLAALLCRESPELQANVLLLTDGADTASSATEDAARDDLRSAEALTFAVALGSGAGAPSLSQLTAATGGTLFSASSSGELGDRFSSVRQALQNQYEVVYRSSGVPGRLVIELTDGASGAEVLTSAERRRSSPVPERVPAPPGPVDAFLTGSSGRLLAVSSVALLAALLTWLVARTLVRPEKALKKRLRPYLPGAPSASESGGENAPRPPRGRAMLGGVVRLISRVAPRSSLLTRLETFLDQADVPLRPEEALCLYAASLVVAAGGSVWLTSRPTTGLLLALAVAAVPVVSLRMRRRRRLRAFDAQLPDTLTLLAGALRAGHSFVQALDVVARETAEPAAGELRRALAHARLGRPLEDTLAESASRMESRDLEWVVLATGIQREVGGNLAELLQTVSETIVQRERLRREVRTLTAEGRLSAIIMGLLPVGLAAFLSATSPDYLGVLFSSPVGWGLVVGGIVLECAGFAWLRKIVKVEA